MRYKNSIKLIIDKRKLDTLMRLNCPIEILINLILKNELKLTGDELIDDNLESLIEIKQFSNWGGNRKGAGRPIKNQLENQDENQDGNQDIIQVGDKDKDIDKDIDKLSNSIDIDNITNIKDKKFKKPTIEEIKQYCLERGNSIDSEHFYNHYETIGWMIGKNKMKDWKAAIRTWERNQIKWNSEQKQEEKSPYRMA
jgi:hypothetical protein